MMQYSTVLASLLAAAGAVNAAAAGHGPSPSKSVTVTLRAGDEELRPFVFPEPRDAVAAHVRVQEPITEVELSLNQNVMNQEFRCQIVDESNNPIVVLRGENTDVAFSDGGKGPWTLREPTVVSRVVCDQAFEKIDPEDERLQVRVLIQSQNPEVGIAFELSGVKRDTVAVEEKTPIETVILDVSGELVDPALRCQLVGADGPITVLRGDNVKQTFADGDGGPWTLQKETIVDQIICDPEFQNQE
ncbi:hypothetical protein VUR80DRAFT_5690 [Thermomyces stellatus]